MSEALKPPRAKPVVPRLTYTVQEAASALGVSRRTIYELIDRKELEAGKVLGRRLIRAKDLEAMVDRAFGQAA